MFTDKLTAMRQGGKTTAERLAAALVDTIRCQACGRRYPREGGYIVRYSQDRMRVHIRRLCDNCGARMAALMGPDDDV